MEKEKSLGYDSSIVNFKKDKTRNINFDLRIYNLGLFYQCMKFIYYILKRKPDIVFAP